MEGEVPRNNQRAEPPKTTRMPEILPRTVCWFGFSSIMPDGWAKVHHRADTFFDRPADCVVWFNWQNAGFITRRWEFESPEWLTAGSPPTENTLTMVAVLSRPGRSKLRFSKTLRYDYFFYPNDVCHPGRRFLVLIFLFKEYQICITTVRTGN